LKIEDMLCCPQAFIQPLIFMVFSLFSLYCGFLIQYSLILSNSVLLAIPKLHVSVPGQAVIS
jgi:hypothetical protein